MTAPTRQGIPLVPDPERTRDAAVTSLVRAAIATAMAALDKNSRASDYARQWGDRNTELILRAVSSPATTSIPALTQVAYSFLDVLTPLSAGADLLRRALGLN